MVDPSDNHVGCWFSVRDRENVSRETTITLLNDGGKAGYGDRVAFWADRSQTASPVADFVAGGEAVLIDAAY